MSAGEKVNVMEGHIPPDYHCMCQYCQKSIGELRPPDGSYYSRLERRQYYHSAEKGKSGHIAKTPLHIARWAIQAYTKPGDWVLDPTIGAGTTAVEAITQGRSAMGMELEYSAILQQNLEKALNAASPDIRAVVAKGDARDIAEFLSKVDARPTLCVNNPPYSGDESMPSAKKNERGKDFRHLETVYKYDKELPNLAFLKEGAEYWETMEKIYRACVDRLVPGGHFVTGIKDMMRKKAPFLLHKDFCDLLSRIGLQHVGTAFLRHSPSTLFMNTYEQFHGSKPIFYQTVSVFQKPLAEKTPG